MANRIIFALSKQHTGRRSPVGSFGSPGTPPPPQHRSTAWPAGLPRPCSQWSTRHLYGNTSRQHHNTGCGTHAACCLLWLCNFERHLPGRKEPWCCPVTPYTSGRVCADTGHWTLNGGPFDCISAPGQPMGKLGVTAQAHRRTGCQLCKECGGAMAVYSTGLRAGPGQIAGRVKKGPHSKTVIPVAATGSFPWKLSVSEMLLGHPDHLCTGHQT